MKDFSFVSNIGDKIDNATKVMSEKPEGFFDFVSTNLGVVCIMVILVGALFLVGKDVFLKAKDKLPDKKPAKKPGKSASAAASNGGTDVPSADSSQLVPKPKGNGGENESHEPSQSDDC